MSVQHRAGFVNIIGRPNVGKSTLSNALIGERLSVITHKAQTTRHRILGIVNEEHLQIVFSDTPGIVRDPKYKLHEQMNRSIRLALQDADLILFVTEVRETYEEDDPILPKLQNTHIPLLVLLNKTDLHKKEAIRASASYWANRLPGRDIHCISALHSLGIPELKAKIAGLMPIHPPYFPKDALTDKPERFFVNEIIREKILLHYRQEVPYSVEVAVETFKEEEEIIRIRAIIYANRKSQKFILIGKGGRMLKKVGTDARKDMEEFFGKKVFLELFVKVRENWRDRESDLRQFGYH